MEKTELCIVVKYATDIKDLRLIRLGNAVGDEVESTHDFLVLPACYNRCFVSVERGEHLITKVWTGHRNLSPTHEIGSFVHALHHNEEELEDDELKELQNYWNNLKFDEPSALLYKPAWEQLKDANADEETFIINLLKGSVKGIETCDVEVGDCRGYNRITIVYDIEIPKDEEFDIEKLDFFGVDVEKLDCWEDLSNVFSQPRPDLFLDAIIYDGKVYTGTIRAGIYLSERIYAPSEPPEKVIPRSRSIGHLAVETLEAID